MSLLGSLVVLIFMSYFAYFIDSKSCVIQLCLPAFVKNIGNKFISIGSSHNLGVILYNSVNFIKPVIHFIHSAFLAANSANNRTLSFKLFNLISSKIVLILLESTLVLWVYYYY